MFISPSYTSIFQTFTQTSSQEIAFIFNHNLKFLKYIYLYVYVSMYMYIYVCILGCVYVVGGSVHLYTCHRVYVGKEDFFFQS